jgi:hypothetical protein
MNRPLIEILSDPGFWVIFGVMFFLGLTLGWFFRKGSIFWIFVAMLIFAPLLDFLIRADVWIFTVPYVLGFLVHTAKPLWRRLSR